MNHQLSVPETVSMIFPANPKQKSGLQAALAHQVVPEKLEKLGEFHG
jgi:hypothetical protein